MTKATHAFYFYQAYRLITVKQGSDHRAILRTSSMPLAEQRSGTLAKSLLAVEGSGTVLRAECAGQSESHEYSAYGHDPRLPSSMTVLGFNGEALTTLQADYALGQGHRSFSPARMRFNSPDSLSPFGVGGLNAYGYCEGEPINHVDPSGRAKYFAMINGQYMLVGRNSASYRGNWRHPNALPSTQAPLSLTPNPSPVSSPLPELSSPNRQIPQQAVLRYGDARANPPAQLINDPKRGSLVSHPQTAPKPLAVVRPNQSTQLSNQYVHQPNSPLPSAPSSRDSTPPGSRSPSPARASTQPRHVQTAIDIRNSGYYSRRFEPL